MARIPRNAWRIQQAWRTQSAREELQASHEGRTRPFVAIIEQEGTGESTTVVWFPHYYVETPAFTYGLELVGNHALPAGRAPIGSMTVRSWITEEVFPGQLIYKGARILVVVTGGDPAPAAQRRNRFRFHARFEGRAVMSPLGKAVENTDS